MHERDMLYKRAKKSKSEADWIVALRIRNLCNAGVRLAKNNLTQSLLENHKKDSHKFWKTIDLVWNGKGNSNPTINLVDQESGSEIPHVEVPTRFNEHLRNVGAKLAAQFRGAPPPWGSY